MNSLTILPFLATILVLTSAQLDDYDDGFVPGGFTPINTDNLDLHRALMAVERTMSDRYPSEYVSQVVKVLEAEVQYDVQGRNFFVTLQFGQTHLLKVHQDLVKNHPRLVVIRNKLVTCEAEVYERWVDNPKYELTMFQCNKQ